MRRSLALVFAVPTVALAACGGGGSSDEDQIKGIINDTADKPATLCDHPTDKILKQVGGTKEACVKIAKVQKASKKPDSIDVTVDGDKATAKFKDPDSSNEVGFVKEGDDWKVDTVK